MPTGLYCALVAPRKEQAATPTSRRDSAELLERMCGLGDECEFRTKRSHEKEDGAYNSRTISSTPIDTDADTEGALADADLDTATVLKTLQQDTNRRMTQKEMRTDFVERGRDTLVVLPVARNPADDLQRLPWLEESARSRLKQEVEYREELEREGQKRKTTGAMLLTYH